jgi:hypothetical protein
MNSLLKKYSMKKIIVTSFLVVSSIFMAMGQSVSDKGASNFTLGAFVGMNIPQLEGGSGNPLSENWKSRQGDAFGITLNWNTGSHFAWRVDLLYSSEGGQRNGMQALAGSSFNPQVPAGTYFYANYNNESILNYLEVPVMAKNTFSLSKSSNLYVDFGPYVGFLLNATQKTGGSSIVYADAAGTQPVTVNPQTGQPYAASFNASTDITKQINTINIGLTGGIGFTQNVGFGELVLDLRGAYGLSTIQHNPANGDNHIGNLLISLGYSIPL